MDAEPPGDVTLPRLPKAKPQAPCVELGPVVYGWTRGRDPALDRAWWQNREAPAADSCTAVPVFR